MTSMHSRLFRFCALVGIGFLVFLQPAMAQEQSPEEKGLAIAIEADRRDEGFGDSTSDTEMILRNRHGDESVRHLRMRVFEVNGDGDKSLVVFDRPRDVKGTALLTFSHETDPDEQWIFLPALKRVKRIASNNKSGPFMGSEFAYEDLSSQEVAKYSYKYLRDEVYEGQNCFVVERYPEYENSGYTRQVAWIDQAEYRALKVEYYDRKNAILKTQTFLDYEQYLDKHWRPTRMEMINHQTKKSTTLNSRNIQFQVGLTDRDFDKNSLSRVR